MKVYSILLS